MSPVQVPSHLAYAIIVTLFCCTPFGIVAIVYAAQAMSHSSVGNLAAAQMASQRAQKWCRISLGLGLVGGILYALAILMGEL